MAGEWLLLQDRLNLRIQSIETSTHVGHTSCQPDPDPSWKLDHLRRLSRTQRTNVTSAPLSTLMFALPTNSMWIAPPHGAWTALATSVGSGASSAEIVTGSNAVALLEPLTNWPRSKRQCHLNTRFAFTPCSRAISATLAPGSILKRTIFSFSDACLRLLPRRGASASQHGSCSHAHPKNRPAERWELRTLTLVLQVSHCFAGVAHPELLQTVGARRVVLQVRVPQATKSMLTRLAVAGKRTVDHPKSLALCPMA